MDATLFCNVDYVIQSIGLDTKNVLNIYRFGSRLYGSHNETSDYDYRIVCRDYRGNEHAPSTDPLIDACVYSPQEFEKLICDHDMLILTALFAPNHMILQETIHYTPHICLQRLKGSVIKETHKTWDRAKLLLQSGEDRVLLRKGSEKRQPTPIEVLHKAHKNLIHGLRYLHFGIQIAENNKINDFSVANSYKCVGTTWEECEAYFKPLYQSLAQQLKLVIDTLIENKLNSTPSMRSLLNPPANYKKTGIKDISNWNVTLKLKYKASEALEEFLQNEGALDELIRFFAIQVSPFEENLFHLCYDNKLSPIESLYVQDCSHVVVSAKREIVAFSFQKMFGFDEEFSWKFPKDGIVYEHVDGIQAMLFYYNDKWLVSTNPLHSGFVKLFWELWETLKYSFPESKTVCYTFSMSCTRETYLKHVSFDLLPPFMVAQNSDTLVLLGARDMVLKKEMPISQLEETNWNIIKPLSLTPKEAIEASLTINPNITKGFVVVGSDFHRIKVTSPSYLALVNLHSSTEIGNKERENLLDLVRYSYNGAIPPLYEKAFEEIKSDYELFIHIVQTTFDKFVQVESLKEFAKEVKLYPYASLLFSMKKDQVYQVAKLVAQREIKAASLNVWIPAAIKYNKRHNS